MKTQRITRTIIATMVAVSLAGSGSAWAERKNDQRTYGHTQGSHQDKRSQGRSYGGHQDKRSHGRDYGGHQGKRSYGRVYGGQKDKHHSGRSYGGHRDKYYAYNKHKKYKHKRHHYQNIYKPKHYRGYGRPSYYNYYKHDDDNDDDLLFGLLMGGLIGYAINGAQQHDSYAYDSYPQAHTQREPQAAIYGADRRSDATCLQEREYQMKVMVGGRSVDAYGTACLQPDGSWSRGPAKLASF